MRKNMTKRVKINPLQVTDNQVFINRVPKYDT